MPTIELSRKDLNALVGFPEKEYLNLLPQLKCEIEGLDGDKLVVEVTADRIDLLSVEGIARVLRTYLSSEPENDSWKNPRISVKQAGALLRPYFSCAVVRNVKLSNLALVSMMQLQEKLHATFGRGRSRIAIGLHDISGGDPVNLVYEDVSPSSHPFVPLGEKKSMTPGQILVHHEKGKEFPLLIPRGKKVPRIHEKDGQVFSLPPIINGEYTRLT